MSQVYYYQVERNSPSWLIIRGILKQRDAALKARRAFIESEYPDWKRGDWQMTVCAPRIWGIVPPVDAKGFLTIPDGWRNSPRGVGIVPKKNHPIGKRLAAEMAADKYMVPGCNQLADALGIKAYFAPGSGHMVLHTAGLEVPRKEVYVLLLHPKQKAPSDCKRISDLEFEALSKRKSRKTPA